jgi:hypothetical protein
MTFDRRALFVVPALAALSAPMLIAPQAEAGAAQARPARGGLCAPGEVIIFQCGIGRKMVSVCGSRTPSPHAQYRFGRPGAVELSYPSRSEGGLSWARAMYSGGGELQIRFRSGGLDYAVYSRTIRTGFGADGRNNPQFSDGVMVRRGSRVISNRACTTEIRADGQPEDFMPEGTMLEQ